MLKANGGVNTSVNLLAEDHCTGRKSMWVPGSLHSVCKRCLLSVTGWTNNVSFLTFPEQKTLRGCEVPGEQHGRAQLLLFSRGHLTPVRVLGETGFSPSWLA